MNFPNNSIFILLFWFFLFPYFNSCQSVKKPQESTTGPSVVGTPMANKINENADTAQINKSALKLCQSKENFPRGVKILISSIERKESVELNFFRLGICFLYAGQYKRAIFNFNRSLFNSNDIVLKSANLHNIAYAQLKMGKYKRSMEYLKEAGKLAMHPMTSYNLASLQLHLNLVNDQSDSYQWLKSRTDTSDKYLEILADLSISLSYYDDAVKYFEKISSEPMDKNSDLIVHYLMALHRTNKVEQIKKVLIDKKMFIENNPYYQQMVAQYPEIGKFD
ncbi:MAG: tetratricopeptide repeat protein [Bacteriovoracaceae bacterium]|nr:tetratricopeptide repeat protein [Bacteriovoracaceae bacterium]